MIIFFLITKRIENKDSFCCTSKKKKFHDSMKEEGQDSKEKQKYHNDIKKEKIFTKFFSPFFRFYFKAIKGRPDLLIKS